jgi:ureidoacrylate peracid hydrolase
VTTPGLQLPARYYRTFPVEAPLGHAEETLDLGLRRTAFLLVDVNGLGYDGDDAAPPPGVPAFYADQAKASRRIVRDHIVPAKQAATRAGIPVIYLSNHLSPTLNEHSEWRNMSLRVHNIDVLQSWQEPNDILAYSKVIAPGPGEFVVKKQLYSGFFETQLDSLLRSLDICNLVTVGFDSRICPHTTVIDAMYRNYRVIVLRDAIGTSPLASGDNAETGDGKWADATAVRFIETNVGYTATSEQWVAACDAHAAGAPE